MKEFKKFQESLKGISRKIKGCFNEVLSGLQGCLKEVEWVFEGVSKVFQGCFKKVLGVFRETIKGDSRELLGI